MSAGKVETIRRACGRVRAAGGTVVPEPMVKEWLREKGIPVPRGEVVESAAAASRFARACGYPVVLKIVSDRMLHKTEVGGVQTGIRSEKELRAAFAEMARTARRLHRGTVFRHCSSRSRSPPASR